MQVVYYHDDDLNICPVKKYLECFLPNRSDNLKIQNRKNHILATIYQKIQFVKEHPGKQAPFLGTLHGHDSIEIKNRKNKNILIRILYKIYDNKIILLLAFEKPDNYDTEKIKKEVNKYYSIADMYIKKIKMCSNKYEAYE